MRSSLKEQLTEGTINSNIYLQHHVSWKSDPSPTPTLTYLFSPFPIIPNFLISPQHEITYKWKQFSLKNIKYDPQLNIYIMQEQYLTKTLEENALRQYKLFLTFEKVMKSLLTCVPMKRHKSLCCILLKICLFWCWLI